jgi:hypothetical protein
MNRVTKALAALAVAGASILSVTSQASADPNPNNHGSNPLWIELSTTNHVGVYTSPNAGSSKFDNLTLAPWADEVLADCLVPHRGRVSQQPADQRGDVLDVRTVRGRRGGVPHRARSARLLSQLVDTQWPRAPFSVRGATRTWSASWSPGLSAIGRKPALGTVSKMPRSHHWEHSHRYSRMSFSAWWAEQLRRSWDSASG